MSAPRSIAHNGLRLLAAIAAIAILAPQPAWAQAPQPGPQPQQPGQQAQIVAGPGPFQLTPAQENDLNNLLTAWEQVSANISTLQAEFTMWEYNGVFGNAQQANRQVNGEIRFAAPDKGLYKVNGDGGEHWICDGKAIYEFNATKKQLVERRLPPEMQGKAISDGPLPFVFGVKAEKMKERYWMRVVTPADKLNQEVWLEVYPKRRQDAANFSKAVIILVHQTLLPYALQLHLPNGQSRTVYRFEPEKLSVNNPVHKLKNFVDWFVAPTAPIGWQHVIEQPPGAGMAEAPAEGALR